MLREIEELALELHSRAAPSVEAHHRVKIRRKAEKKVEDVK